MSAPENYREASGTLREAATLLRVRGAATVHDALAVPLAAWLDHQADLLPTAVGGADNADTAHALAVARVILGSADS